MKKLVPSHITRCFHFSFEDVSRHVTDRLNFENISLPSDIMVNLLKNILKQSERWYRLTLNSRPQLSTNIAVQLENRSAIGLDSETNLLSSLFSLIHNFSGSFGVPRLH
jgi:hypothetical protein